MIMLESTYHSYLRSSISETLQLIELILGVYIVAVAASLVVVALLVRLQIRQIRSLHGLIPICAQCKKVRDDAGYWRQVESYVQEHSDADFTHSICPDCLEKTSKDIDKDG